uniref:protein acetyllysine N-acetyltransferase n=1 Tax=Heterorhabditis bacteriophora TaxID=37862 RepID=A0A1I7XQX2_HETBA
MAKGDRSQEIEEPDCDVDVKVKKLASWLRCSRISLVYTGAGISTAASIPDYRGPNGIWTLTSQGKQVSQCANLTSTTPTSSHMVLKELYRLGFIKHILSQNCDGLHLRSGLPQKCLSEIHGNMYIELVIVNLQWTPKDSSASLKINAKSDVVLLKLAEELGIDVRHYCRDCDPILNPRRTARGNELMNKITDCSCHIRPPRISVVDGKQEDLETDAPTKPPGWWSAGIDRMKRKKSGGKLPDPSTIVRDILIQILNTLDPPVKRRGRPRKTDYRTSLEYTSTQVTTNLSRSQRHGSRVVYSPAPVCSASTSKEEEDFDSEHEYIHEELEESDQNDGEGKLEISGKIRAIIGQLKEEIPSAEIVTQVQTECNMFKLPGLSDHDYSRITGNAEVECSLGSETPMLHLVKSGGLQPSSGCGATVIAKTGSCIGLTDFLDDSLSVDEKMLLKTNEIIRPANRNTPLGPVITRNLKEIMIGSKLTSNSSDSLLGTDDDLLTLTLDRCGGNSEWDIDLQEKWLSVIEKEGGTQHALIR